MSQRGLQAAFIPIGCGGGADVLVEDFVELAEAQPDFAGEILFVEREVERPVFQVIEGEVNFFMKVAEGDWRNPLRFERAVVFDDPGIE